LSTATNNERLALERVRSLSDSVKHPLRHYVRIMMWEAQALVALCDRLLAEEDSP
jgi:hypothetical protein